MRGRGRRRRATSRLAVHSRRTRRASPCRSSPTRARPMPTCSPRPPVEHPTAPCSWPTTSRPGGAGWVERGTLRRGATCWSRSCSGSTSTSRIGSRNRVAVAAVRACERVAKVWPDLKWPNDLLLDGAKLAGVLAEAGSQRGRLTSVVVGLGLNIGWAPSGAAALPRGTRDEVLLAPARRARPPPRRRPRRVPAAAGHLGHGRAGGTARRRVRRPGGRRRARWTAW